MRRLPRLTAVLLALASVMSACGSGDERSDGATPEQLVRAYLSAFARGDGRGACALLTPPARAGVPQLSDDIRAPDCEGAIRELSRKSERLRSPRVSVEVSEDRATAKIANARPPYQSQALLERQNGSWRIAFPPAVLQRFEGPPGIPSELDGHR